MPVFPGCHGVDALPLPSVPCSSETNPPWLNVLDAGTEDLSDPDTGGAGPGVLGTARSSTQRGKVGLKVVGVKTGVLTMGMGMGLIWG